MSELFFDIDKESTVPMYRQIAETMIEGIRHGSLSPKHALPSSRELADQLDVSRNTINLAYQELMAQGYVASQERRGIFVTPDLTPELVSVPPPADIEREQAQGIDWSRRLSPPADANVPDLVKPASWFDAPYPFIVGQVENRSFPVRGWQRCLREAMYGPHLRQSVMDSSGVDDPYLVEMIRTRLLPSRGVDAAAEEIMITLGTQHGMNLVSNAVLGQGSRVLLEDPGYLDARHILLRSGAHIERLPVDGEGAVVPESLRGVELALLTPSHHCPTNVTLSRRRREQLLELAQESGTIVVEDDHDAEFRYHGQPSPSLKALDVHGHVVHLGSFSKFLAPGLRLGFLVGPAPLLEHLRRDMRYSVRHVPGQLQRAMALFLDSGDYHRALRLHREEMRRKWQLMTMAAEELFPFPAGPFPPGGLTLWCQGPYGLDVAGVVEEAARRGVLLEAGEAFFSAPEASGRHDPPSSFRLGYGAIPAQRIRPGMAVLAEVLRAAGAGTLSTRG